MQPKSISWFTSRVILVEVGIQEREGKKTIITTKVTLAVVETQEKKRLLPHATQVEVRVHKKKRLLRQESHR